MKVAESVLQDFARWGSQYPDFPYYTIMKWINKYTEEKKREQEKVDKLQPPSGYGTV